jgi:hypothetical protein
MSHTYYSILDHCVFSTKERRVSIPADLKAKLWPYIAGIARQNKFKALAVGGNARPLSCALVVAHDNVRCQSRAVD